MSRLACGVINGSYSQGIVSSINTLGNRRVPEITHIDVGAGLDPEIISGDPRVLGYKHGSDNCVMISAYTYTTPGTAGNARVALFKINATTGAWEQLVQKLSTTWGFSNPYGLVVVGNNMYVQDYDSGKITAVDLTTYNTSTLYTMGSVSSGGTTYLPHGNGMDYSDYGLIAIFSYLESGSYSNYTNSKLAVVPVDGSTASVVSGLNKNVVSVAVEGDFAYISSIGGAQQGGGNPASKIESVDLTTPVLGTTPVTISALPTTPSGEQKGDFVDVAFRSGAAYVLRANYDTNYTSYSYRLIKTTGASLRAGSFGTYTTIVDTATPAEATWMLAPAVDTLWFVSGSAANIIQLISGGLSTGSVVKKADASLSTASSYGLGTTVSGAAINAHLNTASVIIDVADVAAKEAVGAAAAVSATRTKVAFRFVRPEELEKK
ncbi:hypothetical protein [Pelosinus sp. IPA-1]|uniref:hypothetical protein n=1 Tax=Pelosinus sp. IPA-1 TaxID=3029569 RepID=UPI0025521B90|nr:hypothetical protein [Pelosinus sp. IPA-1]